MVIILDPGARAGYISVRSSAGLLEPEGIVALSSVFVHNKPCISDDSCSRESCGMFNLVSC